MPWIAFVVALLCFGVVFRTQSVGLAALALLVALILMLTGAFMLISQRVAGRSRDAVYVPTPEEARLLAQKRDAAAVAVPPGGDITGRPPEDTDDLPQGAGDDARR